MGIQVGLPCTDPLWCEIAAWSIVLGALLFVAGIAVAVRNLWRETHGKKPQK